MAEEVKSIVVTDFGGYDCLSVVNYPLPPVKDDYVEVDVYYCGANFADLYSRQGLIPQDMPFVLGMECAGKIKKVGPKASEKCKIGQRVICYNFTGGMFRKVVVVPSSKCFLIPDYVSLKDATALFVNYLTAYFCVIKMGHLQPNESIFISSCSGGVGIAATQLAKLVENVSVCGTTSVQKSERAKQNGVDFVFDYETYLEKIPEVYPNGLDLIIDNQAGHHFIENQQLLKPFGRIILIGINRIIKDEKKLDQSCFDSLVSECPVSELMMNSTTLSGFHLGILAEKYPEVIQKTLDELFSLYKEGKISPVIDSVIEFEKIVVATKRLQERLNIGKVLLLIQPEE